MDGKGNVAAHLRIDGFRLREFVFKDVMRPVRVASQPMREKYSPMVVVQRLNAGQLEKDIMVSILGFDNQPRQAPEQPGACL